jgi:trehalose 6-phosphate phosphatase
MKDILSEEALPVLEEVARGGHLLALDFDGTLCPIVENPADARLSDATRRLLRLVAVLYPCAVVSGRSRADLLPRVDGIPLVAVVGNHGAEAGYGPVDVSVRDVVAAWSARARERLSTVAGVEVEDKGLSLAIHYRRAPAREEARGAVHAVARTLGGARVFDGHEVVNVVPSGVHDKGAAIAALLARVGRRRALYLGDDTTDEDAFRSPAVDPAIRVGPTHPSAAAYYLSSQAAVDDLLRALLRARRKLDGLDDGIDGLVRALGR